MIAGVLAAGLLWAGAVPASDSGRAEPVIRPDSKGGGPNPGYLEYNEACKVGPLEVAPLPDRLRAELERRGHRLPRHPDLSWWGHYDLLVLARAYVLGIAGQLDRAEGERLLCLVLRRNNDSIAAALLAREIAAARRRAEGQHGQGKISRSDKVRHFARVAAVSMTPEWWRERARSVPFARGVDLEPMAEALAEASAWYAALARQPVPVRFRTALTYIHGAGVSKSDRIADHILHTLRFERPEIDLFALRRELMVHRRKLDHPRWRIQFLDSLFMVAYVDRYPEAMVLVGELYLAGELLPHDPMRAYVWMRFGEREGGNLGIDLDRLRASLTPHERAAATELLQRRHPPSFGSDINTPAQDL
jgi:hypothetical protein